MPSKGDEMSRFSNGAVEGFVNCYPMSDSVCATCEARAECKSSSDHEIFSQLATEVKKLRAGIDIYKNIILAHMQSDDPVIVELYRSLMHSFDSIFGKES